MTSRVGLALSLFFLLAAVPACAGRNGETHTFFQNDEDLAIGRIEKPYPSLDLAAQGRSIGYVGITTLSGAVRLSRPVTWRIRRASTAEDHRFVEYASPNEYIFAIYQRTYDSCKLSWGDIQKLYEEDAKKRNVEFVGKAIPTAGYDTQGREYVVRRKIKGQRAPYENTSREFLFRGKHSIALVELVHQGQSDASIEGEVLRAIETFSVL